MAEAEEAEELILQMKEKSACALFSLYSMRQFHSLNELGKRTGRKIRVHIRTDIHDSGMGLGYEEFLKHEEELFFSEGVEISGLYGHLYSAYSDSREEKEKELQAFDELIHRIPEEHRNKILIHVLNSSLSLQFPEYSFDMVRIGSYMYGLTGRNGGYLKPAMRICARIFDVRELDLSVPLSYQPAVLKEGKRRIARAMIGYHDAPILLTQKNLQVLIRGQLFPLADDICMDNISIDVTGCKDVAVGDTVVMLGEAGVRDDKVVERTGLEYVHTDRLTITAERLEKIYR
jgi:alanine racemase